MLLSYSKLKIFFECPLKFQKVALEGSKEQFGEDQLAAMQAGSNFHQMVKEFYENPFPPSDYIESRAAVVANKLAEFEPLGVGVVFEQYFTHDVAGVTFQGYVDVVGDDAVYEIKSYDKVGDVEYKQASLYAKALDKKTAVLLTPNQAITLDSDKIESYYAQLEEAVKQILENNFEPRTGKQCETCPALLECPLMNSLDSIQSTKDMQTIPIDKLAELYDKLGPLMKAIERQLKNAAQLHKQIPLSNGKVLMEVTSEYKVLRDGVTPNTVLQDFGIDYLTVDTKKLQNVAPDLFETRYRKTWQISNPEREQHDGGGSDDI